MIKQSITKYKENRHHHWAIGHYPPAHTPVIDRRPVHDRPYTMGRVMTKVQYGIYLAGLNVHKGDLVTSKWSTAVASAGTYHPGSVYMVVDIIEVHHHVEWGPPVEGPLCYILQPINLSYRTIKGGGDLYVKVPPSMVPEEWKTRILGDNTTNPAV